MNLVSVTSAASGNVAATTARQTNGGANVSMNVSTNVSTNGGKAPTTGSTGATAAVRQVPPALTQVGQRLGAQLDTTRLQLSGLGRVKSAIAALQGVAQPLTSLPAGATAADVRTALTRFVGSFNAARAAAQSSSGQLSAGDASGARRVASDLGRGITSQAGDADALKSLGLTAGTDGALAVDSAKLAAAWQARPDQVRATLKRLGQATDSLASAELSDSGHVGAPLAALARKAHDLTMLQGRLNGVVEQTATVSPSPSPAPSSASGLPTAAQLKAGLSAYGASV